MPDEEEKTKVELRKLKDLEVNNLKGKLVEVRRIGAQPSILRAMKKYIHSEKGKLTRANYLRTNKPRIK